MLGPHVGWVGHPLVVGRVSGSGLSVRVLGLCLVFAVKRKKVNTIYFMVHTLDLPVS